MSGILSNEEENMTTESSSDLRAGEVAGIVIAAVIGVLLLSCCCLVVVVFLVKRHRVRKREQSIDIPGEYKYKGKLGPKDGITNAMYAIGEDHIFDGNSEKAHDYTLPKELHKADDGKRISFAYDYATTEPRMIPTKKESFRQDNTPKQSGSKHGREKIYMVPADNERSLYAQIIDMRIQELERTSIQLGEILGTGNFATVNKGVMTTEGGKVDVAVKTLKEGSEEEDRIKFLQEATIMGQFKHPNVVKLHGVVMEDEPVLIVLELLAKGDLRQLLEAQQNSMSIDEHTLLSYCRQVASGMVYLSSKAFVHRDLAARNILVSDKGLCKIADFGLSRDLMDEEYYVSHGGKIPVKWTAPEAIHYRKYSSASDVWSFGVVLFEIWSLGRKPYEDFSLMETIRRLEDGYRLPPPPGTPRTIYELMINTWEPISADRPSFVDIMQQLSLPDTHLLQSPDSEDGAASSDEVKLGADLSCGLSLYTDLQHKYHI